MKANNVSTETCNDSETYYVKSKGVDPTRDDGQGGDIGEQYLLGVYYRDAELKGPVTDFLTKEKEKYPEFHVENKPLEVFYEAEEYHQDYLIKNPTGYCHITQVEMDEVRKLNK